MKVTVTPQMALEMLEGNAANQRKLSAKRVNGYVTDIRTGMWLYNGESIIMTTSGRLIDGQHRLNAVVKAGVSIEVAIINDVPDKQNGVDTFLTINASNRSNADVLYIDGMKTETPKIARLLLLINTFNKQKLAQFPSGKQMTNHEIVYKARSFGESRALHIIERAKNLHARFPTLGINYWMVAVYALSEAERGVEFLETLANGDRLSKGNPIGALVEFLGDFEGSGGGAAVNKAKFIAMFKAYNYFINEVQVDSLSVSLEMGIDYPKDFEDYEEA